MQWIVREIIECGRRLFEEDLVSARAGNISYSYGEELYITRSGASLSCLTPQDIIRVNLQRLDTLDERASSELIVHRKVIRETALRAVVHAHPVSAVVLSYETDLIKPVDSEGYLILGEVPVVSPSKVTASSELAISVSNALLEAKVVVVKGHGAFSAGNSPLEAWAYLSTLEHSCRILLSKRR